MVFKLLCILLLCCLASCSGSSSSGRGKESQYCGEDQFYCPDTQKCLDRNLRCTTSKVCVDSSGEEPKCFKASQGRYKYYRKKSPLSSSSSRRKKRWDFMHWFVEYRGFVYEFGSYGFQELDVNDPNYKYGPGREKVEEEQWMGTSSCTRDDVLRFRDDFLRANPNYSLIFNNCQDFVNFLLRRLESNCSTRKGRSLDDEMKSLKANCTVSSSSPIVALNWKLFTSLPALILFTIFRMY